MRAKLLKSMIGIRMGENLRNEETEKFYVVKRLQEDTVALESRDGEGEILVTRTDIKTMYTKTVGTKLCNVFRAPVFWITIVSGPLFFSRYISTSRPPESVMTPLRRLALRQYSL